MSFSFWSLHTALAVMLATAPVTGSGSGTQTEPAPPNGLLPVLVDGVDGLNSVACGKAACVAVGPPRVVLVANESDGTWQASPSGANQGLTDVAAASGSWAAVGADTILTSPDGLQWNRPFQSPAGLWLRVASDSEGLTWVAGGAPGFARSKDAGRQWSAIGQDTQSQDRNTAVSVASNGSIAAMVGIAGIPERWPTGQPWSERGTTDNTRRLTSLANKGGLWVAVGEGGVVLHSNDALVWTTTILPRQLEMHAVAASPTKAFWVSVGDGGAIFTSSDGSVWQERASGTKSQLRDVAVAPDGHRWVAVGTEGAIVTSDDGIVWTLRSSGTPSYLNKVSVSSDGKLWTAIALDGLLTSSDGLTWRSWHAVGSRPLRSIAVNKDGQWLALSKDGTIAHSQDGMHWNTNVSVFNAPMPQRIFDSPTGDRWLGLAADGLYARGTDGTWSGPAKGSGVGLHAFAFHPGSKKAVAVGRRGAYASEDLSDWKAVLQSPSFELRGIAMSPVVGLWVAVGDGGTIATSVDGTSWKLRNEVTTSHLLAVAVSERAKRWVAVGTGGRILVSDNAIDWREASKPPDVTGTLNAVAVSVDGRRWIAAGDRGLALESTNGYDWHVVPTATSAQFVSIAEYKDRWALAGSTSEGGIAGQRPAYVVLDALTPRAGLASPVRWIDEGERIGAEVDVARYDAACARPRVNLKAARMASGGAVADALPVAASAVISLETRRQATELILWDPAKSLRLNKGERFAYSIEVACEGDVVAYPMFDQASLVTWRPWWRELSAWWLVLVWFAAVLVVIHALYRVAPLTLLAIWRRLDDLGPLGKVNVPVLGISVGDFAQVMNLWMLPVHALRPRTLDAWVAKHRQAWSDQGFNDLQTVKRNAGYVPLPCRTPEIVDRPTSDIIRAVLTTGINRINVLGEGGAGKTMLTIEMGRWLVNGQCDVPRLPVLIEEDLEGDPKSALQSILKRKLGAIIEEEPISDRFLLALLKHGRIVPVFDRLSERSAATFRTVERLHGNVKLALVVVSSRRAPEYEGAKAVSVLPLPLDSNTVMFLVTALINRSNVGHFARLEEQSSLVNRLAKMISVPGKPDHTVTPLLVRLFVDRALTLVSQGESLDHLPRSIPATFADELRDKNPTDAGAPHFMLHDQMFRAARLLARESLGDNYVPQEITLDKARDVLRAAGWTNPATLDPVTRLQMNGALILRDEGTRTTVSFALDPVAEFLAAESYVEEIGMDIDRMEALRAKVISQGEPASGFLAALQIVWLDWTRHRRR